MNLSLKMQEELGITGEQFTRLVARAPYAYKIYEIDKRSGGTRTIAQPARETKFVQSWLIEHVFGALPIHECATAYGKGASILKNVDAHKENSFLAKFDFRNFFPSIKYDDLLLHFSIHLSNIASVEDVKMMARIACMRSKASGQLQLSIGAPSSPIISNSVMFEFDCRVAAWCAEQRIVYTRYADDLAFSTNVKGATVKIEPIIRKVLREIPYPLLQLNNKKTIHVSKKYQRRITGLVINNADEVSLGRERKREIGALVHKSTLGLLNDDDVFRLQGLLGFAKDVEPQFVIRLRAKYTCEVIDAILQLRKPSKAKS
ncbi:retron St85 family RNA-directed DNA polymerase [Burkholderia gladioli]|uniref:retron St85 family RNA-directed DNA polymerase n=1 Tax=Burkholderia gladioli TaxID=28095 RepID=UPI00164077E1|nr:retron St85 family RNA-directed DNA polymerase [Burkholderia gladioli]